VSAYNSFNEVVRKKRQGKEVGKKGGKGERMWSMGMNEMSERRRAEEQRRGTLRKEDRMASFVRIKPMLPNGNANDEDEAGDGVGGEEVYGVSCDDAGIGGEGKDKWEREKQGTQYAPVM
jgi:hypothetical protein